MQRTLWMVGFSGAVLLGCGGDGDDKSDSGANGDAGNQADGSAMDSAAPVMTKVENAGAMCTPDTAAADCQGPMAKCETEVDTPAIPNLGSEDAGPPPEPTPYPGGLCTASCVDNGECGDGGGCVGLAVSDAIANSAFGDVAAGFPLPLICAQSCAADTECRTGYVCINVIDAVGSDLPAAVSMFLPILGINVATLPTYCLPEPPPPVEMDGGVDDAGTDAATDAGTDADAGDAGDEV